MSNRGLGVILAAFVTLAPLVAEAAERIEILVGHVRPITGSFANGTIAIGDPEVVDITVAGEQSATLTGRSVGLTNIVIYDAKNKIVSTFDIEVMPVTRTSEFTVRRISGGEDDEFACGPAPGCTKKEKRVVRTQGSAEGTVVLRDGTVQGRGTESTARTRVETSSGGRQ